MTALFVFLGAPLLRVLRGVFGASRYWLAGLVIGLVMWFSQLQLEMLALLICSIWITVGVYSEFEERGYANFYTASLSIALGSIIMLVGPVLWGASKGVDLVAVLNEQITNMLKNNKQLFVGFELKPESLTAIIPSMMIIMQMSALAFALMLDRRSAKWFNLRFDRVSSHMRLLQFKAPDVLIWFTMASFLLSFLKLVPSPVSAVSMNIFNTMMGVYFFQGLAVMEFSFLVFRVGNFMKAIIYLLIVGQLFFLLSAVGFIDYWVDFRKRLKNWSATARNSKNGEHV